MFRLRTQKLDVGTKSIYLYTVDDIVVDMSEQMDYSKHVNKIPYENFGGMLSSGELIVIQINYGEAYTIVVDGNGNYWKVKYQQDGFFAILTRVNNV